MFYENSVLIGDKRLVPLTQYEIADMIKISRITTNRIVKELKNDGLIEYKTNETRKYYITDKGIEVVKKIKSIKD